MGVPGRHPALGLLVSGGLALAGPHLPVAQTNGIPSGSNLPPRQVVGGTAQRDADISYAIGVDVARHFRKLGIQVVEAEVHQGFLDGLSGDRLRMPETQARMLVVEVQNDALRRASAQRRSVAQVNQQDADQFLERNKSVPGVVTLPSGLQYRVLKAGSGPLPRGDSTVTFQYRLTYLDGAEFSASAADKPVTVQPDSAPLKAWQEALRRMPQGARWRLFVPPALAYGAAGVGREIGPNLGLIYDIEVVEVR